MKEVENTQENVQAKAQEEHNPYYRHQFLNNKDKERFESECNRIHTTYGLSLNRRASGDTAMRAFLIAEKGYTIDQAMGDLSNISNEEYMKLFDEYISRYANPEKTPEENLSALGEMHAKLYKKMQDYTIPFPDGVKNAEQMIKMQQKIKAQRLFMIDMGQDYESVDYKSSSPSFKTAYMNGVGDVAEFEKNKSKAISYFQHALANFKFLSEKKFTIDSKAITFNFFKDYYKQYGGKKISEIPNNKLFEVASKLNVISPFSPEMVDPKNRSEYNSKLDPIYTQYLNGKSGTYPKQKDYYEFSKAFSEQTLSSPDDEVKSELKDLKNVDLNKYGKTITEEAMNADNLMTLPDAVKHQMECAYYQSYGNVYRSMTLHTFMHAVKDQFDLIRTVEGKTIREYVEGKYEGLSEAEKQQAMRLETFRLGATEGVFCDSMKLDTNGNLTRMYGELTSIKGSFVPEKVINENLDTIRGFFDSNYEQYLKGMSVVSRELRFEYPEDISPELSVESRGLEAEYGYKLEQYHKILNEGLPEANRNNVIIAYNLVAKEKGWKAKGYDNSALDFEHDQEKERVLVDLIIKEYEKHPALLVKDYDSIGKKISEIKTPLDMDVSELMTKPYEDQINSIKETTNDFNDKEMLDQVNEYLSERTRNAEKFLTNYNFTDRGPVSLTAWGSKKMENYMGGHFGKYGTMNEKKKMFGGIIEYSVPANPQLQEDFKNIHPTFSDGTKSKIIDTVNKIKETGFVNKDSQIEQSYKIYIHEELLKAKSELINAVNSKDIEKIRQAKEKYATEHRKMVGLFQNVRENFGNIKVAPGNVSTLRNQGVPPEFSMDVINDSKLNGLYQVTCACEIMGITIEDFIENPGAHMMDFVQRKLSEDTLDQYNAGDNFLASYASLYNRGKELSMNPDPFGKKITNSSLDLFVDRVMESMMMLEEDPVKRQELAQYKTLLSEELTNMTEREAAYQGAIYNVEENPNRAEPEDLEAAQEAPRTGLKEAFLEGGKIEKRHFPQGDMDILGRPIEKKGSYLEKLKGKNLYNSLKEKLNINIKEMKKIEASGVCDLVALGAIEETMFDYLMAHPEDSKKPEYKDFEKFAMGVHAKLGLPGKSAAVNKYNAWKKNYNTEMNVLYDEAKTKDKQINKSIERYRKQINKYKDNPERMMDLVGQYRTIVDERLKDLADEYRLHRITENYYVERTEQLLGVRESLTRPIGKIPQFIDEKDPDRYTRDAQMITDRLSNNTKDHYLDNITNYKRWKLQQLNMDPLEESELSADEWNALYKSEIEAQTRGIALPEGYRELGNNLNQDINLTASSIVNVADLTESGRLNPDITNDVAQKKNVSFKRRVQELYEKASELAKKDDIDLYQDVIGKKIAECIASETMERMGKLPNGVSPDVFARRLANNANFKKITQTMINTMYSDFNKKPEEGEKTLSTIISLVSDKSIITACDIEQKHEAERQANKDNPNYKPKYQSPGTAYIRGKFTEKRYERHAKKQPKKPEQGRGLRP